MSKVKIRVPFNLKTIRLDSLVHAHIAAINDEMLPHDHYYERFGIALNHRDKVVDLVKKIYNSSGQPGNRNRTKQFSNRKLDYPLPSLP